MYIGIDLGATGAVSFLTSDTVVYTLSLVTDLEAIYEAFEKLPPKENVLVGLEDLGAIFGVRSSSTFTFGKAAGFWEGVLSYFVFKNILEPRNIHYFKAVEWQKVVTKPPIRPWTRGLEKKERDRLNRAHKQALKTESCDAVRRYYNVEYKDHGKCDACNIARYVKYLHETAGWGKHGTDTKG